MAFVARNGLWLTRSPEVPASSVRTSGLIEALATGKMRLASSGDDVFIASAASNVFIGSFDTPDVIPVRSNLVVVNADLQVVGLFRIDDQRCTGERDAGRRGVVGGPGRCDS